MMKNTTTNGYAWFALALLWVAFFLQQGTRQLFGPAVPAICSSLLPRVSLADAKIAVGVVATVFSIVYGLCVPIAGIIGDRLSRKWMVTIGVAVFSAGIFFSGMVSSIGILIVAYGIFNGCGQTFYYPSATSLISQLHPNTCATAMSILQLGLYFGVVGCGTLSGWVTGMGGECWRYPFYIFGAIGIIWSVFLAIFLRNTKATSTAVTVDSEKPMVKTKNPILALTPICIILGLSFWVYVDIGFKTWMPAFLQERFLDTTPSLARWYGLHSVLWHYLGAAIGIIIGSRIGDRMASKRPSIRLELQIIGFTLGVPFIILMSFTPTFVTCCIAMTLFGFARGIYDSNFIASYFAVISVNKRASAVGIMMCVAFLFGSLSSTLLPLISRLASGNSAISMATLSIFYFLGAVVLWIARNHD